MAGAAAAEEGRVSGHVTVRKDCRLCGSTAIFCSAPLASVPIASPNVGRLADSDGTPLTHQTAPLDTYLCPDCGLIQLVHVVDPTLIYGDYLYRTSVSLGLGNHFAALAETVVDRLGLVSGDLVTEIGSNDGTLLKAFSNCGISVQGVDPAAAIAAEATAAGVPTIARFFDSALADEILAERGPAKAILSNNTMANIDDLGEILRGIATLLADGGAFVFETQYALDVFQRNLLDVIYHEHISTFSVQPVVRSFGRYGLEVFDVERLPTKGGSIRFWVQKTGGPQPKADAVDELIRVEQDAGLYDASFHKAFSDRVAKNRSRLHAMAAEARAAGRRVGAYGSSVGCAALIHQYELSDKIDVIFDDSPLKDHLNGPGYSLPIVTGDHVREVDPDFIVVLAWRYAKPIMARHKEYLARGGTFVTPLPDVAILSPA